MKLQEARLLIRNTFENPFDKGRFTLFIKNLLKDTYEEKPFLQTGGQLPQAFAELIRKMERIGKYEDEEGNIIDILVVELKRGHSIEWARTTQRNFIRRYLNGSRGGELKDAALVAFFSEGSDDWRFSLIKMQYSIEKKADELTPAKRFSFLVGKDERSHTAQNQLANLLTLDSAPTLAEIESSFNIETVTKEFFEKYRELFLNLNEHIEKEIKKSKPLREELESQNIDSASFTKKLLGQIVFLYFLQKKGWLGVPKNENWNKGDKQFLRTLLTQALEKKQNFFSDYLVYLFYEALATEHRGSSDPSYYPRLNCRIPFLNGGLFEADYNWKKIEINIPNRLFTNTDKSEEGDIGTGVLDVFDRYNFTVKEDEPLEKEVAVDPEMLGKVFENLLEIKDRKSKGAFYTPREIVHYMCQESLIAYLDTSVNGEAASYQILGIDQTDLFGNKARKGQLALEAEHGSKIKIERKDIEKFIREGISAIDNDIRVELKGEETASYSYLIPESIRNHAKELDDALANIRICDPAIGSGAFPVGMMNEIVKAREILSVYLKETKTNIRTPYEFKRHAIQECIYGVDIDHSAIDIAKLRLWLSLIVDEENLEDVKPLPNLDYKIVEGNSLLGYPYEPKGLDAIEKLKLKFFELTDLKEKAIYRKQINEAIHSLLKNTEKSLGYKVNFDFKIHFSEVFHFKKGFDIVIGNPPFVSALGLKKLLSDKLYSALKINYETAKGAVDLYIYFFEKGIKLLRDRGILAYISPNRYLSASYGEALRCYIFNNAAIHSIVDYSDIRVFTEASTYPILSFIKKVKLKEYQILIGKYSEVESKHSFHYTNSNKLNLIEGYIWGFLLNDKIAITEKVMSQSVPINQVCKVNATSTASEADEYHSLINEQDGYKLINTGTIDRYSTSWGKEPLTDKGSKYLKPFLPRESRRISLNRHTLYSSPKIIFAKIAITTEAFFDSKGEYASINTNCFHSFDKDIHPNYILGWVNSKLFQYTFECFFEGLKMQGGYLLYSSPNLLSMFIKKINMEEQAPFITIVDYLQFIKRRKEYDTISKYVTNDFIANVFDKILDGCLYELFFKKHMHEQKIDILKYVNDYLVPFATNDTVSKKAEIVLKAFNKLNQSDNIIRNRLLLFATRSEDIIMTIEKSISR